MAQFDTQRAQRLIHDLGLIGPKEHEITIFCGGPFQNGRDSFIRQEFQDGRLQTVPSLGNLIDLDISQSFRPVYANKIGVIIETLETTKSNYYSGD